MRRLIKNISLLAGILPASTTRLQGEAQGRLSTLADAYLLIDGDSIACFGPMASLRGEGIVVDEEIDAEGGIVLPAWCDSHTHIVYAGSREGEFVDKIRGLDYETIARRGGGILNSADLLHRTSEDELYRQAMRRVAEIAAKGTGCVEIKSGYGLNTADEIKMLRVIRRIKETVPLHVVATFLGAHAVPREMDRASYVSLVVSDMIPNVGKEGLADYVDVFCDRGFFTPSDTERIVDAAARWGMRAKLHAEELAPTGGVATAVRCGALSVDHLESIDPSSIDLLRGSDTMATLLPGTSFFSRMPYAPARTLVDAGVGVAVASDYNPGSTPSGDMKFVVSLACIQLRLTPEEAVNAATINGAYAMGAAADYGSITVGKKASLIITAPMPSLAYLPYAYTTPTVRRVLLRGEPLSGDWGEI